MQTFYIESLGKGGNTSSGNWHINYKTIKLDYKQRPYTAFAQWTFFRKRDMLKYLENMRSNEAVTIVEA